MIFYTQNLSIFAKNNILSITAKRIILIICGLNGLLISVYDLTYSIIVYFADYSNLAVLSTLNTMMTLSKSLFQKIIFLNFSNNK